MLFSSRSWCEQPRVLILALADDRCHMKKTAASFFVAKARKNSKEHESQDGLESKCERGKNEHNSFTKKT